MAVRTLNLTPIKPAATGKPAVQSAKPAINAVQLQASIKSSGGHNIQPPNWLAVVTTVSNTAAAVRNATPTAPITSLPPPKNYTQISPAYLLSTDNLTFTRSPSDNLKQSIQKFTPYENLTSITNDTPEIVLIANFLPFYSSEAKANASSLNVQKYMTDAARFFDIQAQVRELRMQNVYKLGSSITKSIAKITTGKKSSFQNAINNLVGSTRFLFTTLQNLEDLKSKLDLRNEVHTVQASDVAGLIISKYTGNASDLAQNQAKRDALDRINSQFDISDIIATFGFTPYNILNNYTSTKVWLQLLYEFKQILTTHSILLLDTNNQDYANDASPVAVTKPSVTRFNINPAIQIFNIDAMLGIDPAQINVAIDSLSLAYDSLYNSVALNSFEQKIAAQCVFISREFRYSRALNSPDFQQQLLGKFGYTAQLNGNQTMFDAIIGQFGNDIADIAAAGNSSLVNLSQTQIPGPAAVLTFENKYIVGDNGTTTPGSVYYVDAILENGFSFNTSPLDSLASKFNYASNAFGNLVTQLDLLMLQSNSTNQFLSNPRLLFESIVQELVEFSNGQTKTAVVNDKLGVIFTAATSLTTKGSRLKSTLFMLIMAKISALLQQGGAQLIDALNIQVITQFREAAQGTSVFLASKVATNTTELELFNLLSNENSVLFSFLEIQMSKIYFSFRNKDNDGQINGRTRYGGYVDTVAMLTVFDLLLHAIARYSNQNYAGSFFHLGELRYGINRSNNVLGNSIDDVSSRLDREVALTKQCVYAITNTLQRLRDGSYSVINYINSTSTKEQATAIATTIADDQLLKILTNKQQIMMLNSTVSDFNARLNELVVPNKTAEFSVNGDNNFDQSDLFAVIDDGIVTQKLKTTVMNFLSEPEFLAQKGVNKKILSVGLPVGFTDDLKKKASSIYKATQNSFSDKQTDVVSICVYKIDLQHQDIVYQPIKFLFELSRFPVRLDSLQPSFTTMLDYVSKFPTRDYTQVFETQGVSKDVQYLTPKSTQTKAFDDRAYDYLTSDQKLQIVKNQVVSYLMEAYIRLISGVAVAEHEFSLLPNEKTVPVSTMQALVDASMQYVVDAHTSVQAHPNTGVFFSNTIQKSGGLQRVGLLKKTAGSQQTTDVVTGPAKSIASTVTPKTAPIMMHSLATLDEFSRMVSSLSDGLKVSRRLLAPKKFERVFNMIIDPDDFQVDITKTTATAQGKEALAQLVSAGYITVNPDGTMTNRDKTQGDIGIDKYFVTIETTEPVVNVARPQFKLSDPFGTLRK